MKKKIGLKVAVIGVAILCMVGVSALYAGTTVSDVIKMENKAYDSHKKGIVMFSHKKHMTDYKIGCGECHHDEKGKPLTGLKVGDDVKGCIECHSKPGEKPKGKDAPKLTKQEELAYHAEAIHDNCKECHKAYNKEKGLKSNDAGAAPATCTKCHPKAAK